MADLSAELYGAKKLTRAQELSQELYGEDQPKNDILKSAAIGIPKGLISIPGMIGDIGQLIDPQPNIGEELSKAKTSKKVKAPSIMELLGAPPVGYHPLGLMPTSKNIQNTIEKATGKFYEPKTKSGEYAQAITGAAASAGSVGGKIGLIDRLIAGGLSGAGSKAGGDFAGVPGAVVGGMIMPTVYGVGRGIVSKNPADMLKKNTQGITRQQWDDAQLMIQQAKSQGITLTVPEALNTPAILGLAGDVRSSPSGSAIVNNFMNNRAINQVQPAINRFANNFTQSSQREAGAAAQLAATNIIVNAEKSRTAAWRNPMGSVLPTNEVLKNSTIHPNHIQAVINEIDDTLKHFKQGTPTYSELTNLKNQISNETNAATLNNTRKSIQASIDTPEINASSMNRTAAGVVSPILKKLDNLITNNVSQYRNAQEAYKKASQGIEQLNSSSIGAIAGKHGFEAGDQPQFSKAKGQLFGANNSRNEVANTADLLGDATPKMTNAYLKEQSALAGTRNRPGEVPQDVGARFAQNISANPAQRDNLLAVLKTIDSKNKGLTKFSKEAENLIATMESTGRIPGVGSPTATRSANAEMAGKSALADAINITKGSVLSTASKSIKDAAFAKTYNALAKAITENDVPQIRAIIGKAPELRKQLFIAYLAGTNSTNSIAGKEQ